MTRRNLLRDRRGAAVVELAFALPLILLLLFGTVSYGSLVALNHAVQQSANEGARAALPGLTPAERATLARAAAQRAVAAGWRIAADRLGVSVADDGATLRVTVRYDAHDNPLLSLPLVPVPDREIVRSAAVRLTGL